MKKNLCLFLLIFSFLNTILLCEEIDYMKEHNLISKEILEELKNNSYTLKDPLIVVDPYKISPLTALVAFNTIEESSIKVKVFGKNNENNLEYEISENAKDHKVPIYGLYPGINKVEIKVGKEVSILEIETERINSELISMDVKKIDKEKVNKNFIITSPSISNNLIIYDNKGDIRWYLSTKKIGAAGPIKKLKNGNLLVTSEKQKKPPYYVTSVYEMDFLGKIYREIELKGYGHHEFLELDNGHILGLVDPIDRKTVEDYLIEYDLDGNIVKEMDFKNLIQLDEYVAQDLYLKYNFKDNKNAAIHDWAHANAFAYDKKDNSIVVSFRHLNAIIKFSYETGEILWIFADPQNPWLTDTLKTKLLKTNDKTLYTYGQHAVKVLKDGNILLYDNGNYRDLYNRGILIGSNDYNTENNKSRALELKIKGNKVEKIWEYKPENIYTPFIGDVNKLAENHYIINFGGIVEVNEKHSDDILGVLVLGTTVGKIYGKIIEVKNDKVVFEAETYGQKDSSVYRANRIKFTGEKND
ncbi:MAG: aryl-sulfate sulfotransferase [Fusobacteriaceae bacterium]